MASVRTIRSYSDIDWTTAKFIGRGSYSHVYAIGRFVVVKIARKHTPAEVKGLRDAYRNGIGVPVYKHLKDVPVDTLPVGARDHFDHGTVELLLVGRAVPYAYNGGVILNRTYKGKRIDPWEVIDELAEKASRANLLWSDTHEGNIGFYRGRPVILDGINWER